VTSVSEEPATPAAVEEFLQALPAITHELSEALTAVSAYLAGSRHLFEHGTRFDKIQRAIERADLQARRANDTVRLLRESFGKLGRTRSTVWVGHSG
jgi:phosphoglycerate-specific signal transduction histidine kinase